MIDVCRAQTWTCDETQADPDAVPKPHDSVSLWPDYPRFSAVVDAVEGDVAQLVVGTSNSHPRAPDLGDRVDIHVDTLLEGDRWSLKSHAADVEDGPEDPALVTDGGKCVGNTQKPIHPLEKLKQQAEEAQKRREKEVVSCPDCGTELLKDSIKEAVDTAETHDEKRHDGEPTTKVNGIVLPQFNEGEKEQIQDAIRSVDAATDHPGGDDDASM